jgi:hypothetical protein
MCCIDFNTLYYYSKQAICINVFYSLTALTRGSYLDSRHGKGGLLAQQRRRKYTDVAESRTHILQQRSRPSSQRLADFLRHLAPSSGDCAVTSNSISATLVSVEVPGPAEPIELSASRGRGFPVMPRHCHRACMQNSLVCGSLVQLG